MWLFVKNIAFFVEKWSRDIFLSTFKLLAWSYSVETSTKTAVTEKWHWSVSEMRRRRIRIVLEKTKRKHDETSDVSERVIEKILQRSQAVWY